MARYRKTKNCYTLEEAVEMIQDDDDIADVDNVVIIPPDNAGNITDEEEAEEPEIIPHDVPGTIEVDYNTAEMTEQNEPQEEGIRPRRRQRNDQPVTSWKKSEFFHQTITK